MQIKILWPSWGDLEKKRQRPVAGNANCDDGSLERYMPKRTAAILNQFGYVYHPGIHAAPAVPTMLDIYRGGAETLFRLPGIGPTRYGEIVCALTKWAEVESKKKQFFEK